MIIQTKNNRSVLLRKLIPDDFDKLTEYLEHLSPETKSRFGPHPFDKDSIVGFYENSDKNIGYVVQESETKEIIAYSIIRLGYLEHDAPRLQSNGLTPDHKTDCTFAPSVADEWQSMGIGNHLFQFILSELKANGIGRIILWGGVQCSNEKAVNFYKKNGFKTLGQYEYHGWNFDMVLEIG